MFPLLATDNASEFGDGELIYLIMLDALTADQVEFKPPVSSAVRPGRSGATPGILDVPSFGGVLETTNKIGRIMNGVPNPNERFPRRKVHLDAEVGAKVKLGDAKALELALVRASTSRLTPTVRQKVRWRTLRWE